MLEIDEIVRPIGEPSKIENIAELQILSSATLICHVKTIVMNSGSSLSVSLGLLLALSF